MLISRLRDIKPTETTNKKAKTGAKQEKTKNIFDNLV